jgi:hypothetical protein
MMSFGSWRAAGPPQESSGTSGEARGGRGLGPVSEPEGKYSFELFKPGGEGAGI